eukprot:927710-Prymnesium_polylepis.1
MSGGATTVAFAAVGRLEQYGQCTLLAEVASTSGNMADIAMRILRRLPVAPPGLSLIHISEPTRRS